MSVRRAEVLLAAVIIARSTSFVFNKIGLGTMSAFNMLAVRFLLAFVLLFGGETRYIIETGLSSLGTMVQNFIGLSTFTDPLRTTHFPQTWTIYYSSLSYGVEIL